MTDREKTKMTKRLRIRFITPCVGEDFFKTVRNGIRDAAGLLNVDFTFVGTEDIDIPQQVRMVEQAIDDEVDGIALSLGDAEAFVGAIRGACTAGIPVVAFNVDASEGKAGTLGSVRQNVYEAGKALGMRAAAHIAPDSRVLVTLHSDGASALEARLKGIKEALASKNLSWSTVTTGMVPSVASEKVSSELLADPTLRTILCTGQADTEGAGLAASHLPPDKRPFIAGFDLSPEILRFVKEGVIAFSVDQQPYLQGFLPVVQLVLNIRYGIRPTDVDAGAGLIDRTNAESVLELSRVGYR